MGSVTRKCRQNPELSVIPKEEWARILVWHWLILFFSFCSAFSLYTEWELSRNPCYGPQIYEAVFTSGFCYWKRSLNSWVGVIPKEEWACMLVWHRLFCSFFLSFFNIEWELSLKPSSYGHHIYEAVLPAVIIEKVTKILSLGAHIGMKLFLSFFFFSFTLNGSYHWIPYMKLFLPVKDRRAGILNEALFSPISPLLIGENTLTPKKKLLAYSTWILKNWGVTFFLGQCSSFFGGLPELHLVISEKLCYNTIYSVVWLQCSTHWYNKETPNPWRISSSIAVMQAISW